MARLGEQLTATSVLSTDQVEQALRAQVVWGGRLGTNLIELGCIDLDELSRAIGQQHGVPAALARHFEKADPELQAQLPPELAKQYSVIPLVRLSPERIAVVALDPLGTDGLTMLAQVFGVDATSGIVMSVSAEMRVLYQLERVYKIARPTRFLRSKGASVTTLPQFDLSLEIDIDIDIDLEPEIVSELAPIGAASGVEIDAPPERPHVSVDEFAALIDQAIETAASVEPSGPIGRDRRTYMRTLADDVAPAKLAVVQIPPRKPAPAVVIPALTPPAPTAPPLPPTVEASFDAPTVSAPALTAEALRASAEQAASESPAARTTTSSIPTTGALGRIAIRRVAITGAPPEKPTVPTSFIDSTRAIKRGPNRDRVAELVIETLDRYVPSCAAALLLVIRGDVAIGWKHFSRADDGTAEVAVPLDQDGIAPTVIARKGPARIAANDLGALDGLLLRAVGNGEGCDLVVVPVAIGDQVMCLLAAATSADTELAPLESVASAAGAAFARLIRDASR